MKGLIYEGKFYDTTDELFDALTSDKNHSRDKFKELVINNSIESALAKSKIYSGFQRAVYKTLGTVVFTGLVFFIGSFIYSDYQEKIIKEEVTEFCDQGMNKVFKYVFDEEIHTGSLIFHCVSKTYDFRVRHKSLSNEQAYQLAVNEEIASNIHTMKSSLSYRIKQIKGTQ